MKIATWNVNSIRARMHIVPDWLSENKIDVLLMQEIKCMDNQFPEMEFNDLGYNVELWGQKSMNGVAILSKIPMFDVNKNLPLYEFTDIYNESRYIEAKIEHNGQTVRLCSIYFPNGNPPANFEGIDTDSPRFSYKLDFFDRFTRYIKEQMHEFPHEIFILGGDYNVMHKEIDVYNHKNWVNQIAFLPEERQRMDNIASLGLTDIFRKIHPENKEFSWWNYRFGGFPKNHGLRIDYIFTNKPEFFKNCEMDKSTRGLEKPSDHIPVITELL